MATRIAVDVDGVLADFTAGMWPLLVKQLGREPYTMYGNNPFRWNWSDLGAKDKDVSAVWEQIKRTEDFWLNLPHLEGLTYLLAALNRGDLRGKDLIFLTSRCDTKGDSAHIQTEHWITRKLGLDKPFVWVTPNAYTKVKTLEAAEIDWFLDDFAPTAQMAKYVCRGAYMLRQPWNRADELAYSIHSVDSVREFLDKVKE